MSDFLMKHFWISLGIGLAAGGFGGMLGIGGGLIMIPLMSGLLRLSQHQAHGTSLVALVFTGLSGACAYAQEGNIDYWAVAALAATAMATSRGGAHFANTLPGWKLRKWFGAFLLVAAVSLSIKPWLPMAGSQSSFQIKMLILLIAGAATGFLSGMLGVGGGMIMIPAMVLFVGFGQHAAQGTSLLVMVPVGAAGAWTHYRLGNVAAKTLPGLIPGIGLGAYLGSHAANRIPDTPLRFVFIVLMIFMGIRYILAKTPVDDD